jgi:hypothetical protein
MMATSYRAIVRLAPVEVSPERERPVLDLFAEDLPDGVETRTERDDAGRLLITVSMLIDAEDSSEVQVQARDQVSAAADRAGLTQEAALLDDVEVRTAS